MIYKVISVLSQTYKYRYTYVTIVILALLFIFSTHPFLRYPYDIFAHLITIDELYHHIDTTTHIAHGRLLWHTMWSTLFHFFNIDSQQLFLRVKIIYTIQTLLTLFSLYYFSHVVLRNLFKTLDKITLLYLSTWSTIIWMTIFATHSVYYHLVWNLWYSVNYQITLALFWYITALTLVLILEQTSLIQKLFFTLQILLIARFVIQVHSMELMYFFMYIVLLSLIYLDKLYTIIKKYYYLFVPISVLIIYAIKTYIAESSKIFQYMHINKLPELYNDIFTMGNHILITLNRSHSGSINELMILLYYISLILLIFFLLRYKKDKKILNHRMLIFIFLSATFIFIPLFQFSGGLFALIARPDVIHRIYYSSSLFLLLPVFIYYIFTIYRIPLRYINLVMLSLMISIYLFSKYSPEASHYYYKNIQSIQNSFSPNKYSFHLSQEEIDIIGRKLEKYEKNNQTKKEIYFYARTDIAFVIKYLYHKKVFWKGRRANPDHIKAYQKRKSNAYHNILFETPKGFPRYIPYW